MDDDYTPNIVVVRRMARLWLRKMARPVFSAGLDSAQGQALAQYCIDTACSATTPTMLIRFDTTLTDILMRETGDTGMRKWVTELHTDYHPDEILEMACAAAGIPREQIPVKSGTRISLSEPAAVWGHFGYGARQQCHRLLPDGRWWVSGLHGYAEEIAEISEMVMMSPTAWHVEPPDGLFVPDWALPDAACPECGSARMEAAVRRSFNLESKAAWPDSERFGWGCKCCRGRFTVVDGCPEISWPFLGDGNHYDLRSLGFDIWEDT